MGIEPTSEAWEASILPLYDARSRRLLLIIPNYSIARTVCPPSSLFVRELVRPSRPSSFRLTLHAHRIALSCALLLARTRMVHYIVPACSTLCSRASSALMFSSPMFGDALCTTRRARSSSVLR
jgi:hypothetical protein